MFRIPGTAVLGAALLAVAATPVAFGAPGLQVIYLAPIFLVVWVWRTRTTVDAEGIVVRTVFGSRALPWTTLRSLRVSPKARVSAVLADETQVTLPVVRTRHLPVLAAVSEGRLDDPAGLFDAEPEAAGSADPGSGDAAPAQGQSDTAASADTADSAKGKDGKTGDAGSTDE